ncbi:MAG TPA: DP-EP family protein [Gemmatimonadaceae bacterium]|jgi:hypothetical protein
MPPNPDQTVGVTFNPQNNPQFTFDNDPVRMTAAGKVIFNRLGSTGWTFVGAQVKNAPAGQFTPSVNPGGQVMQINDLWTVMGRWQYRITVAVNGQQYTSPDPEIVNEPPQAGA